MNLIFTVIVCDFYISVSLILFILCENASARCLVSKPLRTRSAPCFSPISFSFLRTVVLKLSLPLIPRDVEIFLYFLVPWWQTCLAQVTGKLWPWIVLQIPKSLRTASMRLKFEASIDGCQNVNVQFIDENQRVCFLCNWHSFSWLM